MRTLSVGHAFNILVTVKTCAPAGTFRKDTGLFASIFPAGHSALAVPTGVAAFCYNQTLPVKNEN